MRGECIKKVSIGVLFTIAVSAWAEQDIRIENASELEENMIFQAYREVKAYYEELGFTIPEDVSPSIIFQDQISIKGEVRPDNLGLFDPATFSIRLVRFESQKFQQQSYLGVEATPYVYYSLIVHELAHYMNALVSPGLPYASNEMIAGTVQLELIDPETRERILGTGEAMRLSSYRDVSLSTYNEIGPQNFILASYGYCKKYPKMLSRFLNQKIPEIKDSFLYD